MTLRFVHAADLHLDSPFTGLSATAPRHVADRLVRATFDAYNAIIDLCVAEQVDALLVAGDVYDGADRSLRAQLSFVDGLNRLDAAGIRSFVCHGNHDPLDGWQARLAFPASCHQFGPVVEAVPFDPANPARATVVGVSYPTRDVTENLALKFGGVPRQAFGIGLLHCNAGNNTSHAAYAPCTISDLISTRLDYWALGHVHTRSVLNPQAPVIVYPGNTQGRHRSETGARGVYLVEVDEQDRVELRFHETSVLRWETVAIDITTMESEQDLLDRIDASVSDLVRGSAGRDLVFRVVLDGRGILHESTRRPSFSEDLRGRINDSWAHTTPFAWCERVEVATAEAFDRSSRAEGNDFVGDLLRLIDTARDDTDFAAELAQRLHPLYRHGKAGRVLANPDPGAADIAALLDDAESACIEALL